MKCRCGKHELKPYLPAPDGVSFTDEPEHEGPDNTDLYEIHRLSPGECADMSGYPLSVET